MEIYKGLEKTFKLPSGNSVTIREQNADDDEILSQIETATALEASREEDIKNLNQFIVQIVVFNQATGNRYITLKEVEAMKLRDKYYILLMSRIHSLGSDINFEWGCRNKACKHKFDVEDDLTRFINPWDNTAEEPEFKPYPENAGDFHELTLASGKVVRFKYMTVQSELDVLALSKDTINRNTELYARELSLKTDEDPSGWLKLSNLAIFSKKEIGPIRNAINKVDSQAALIKEVDCPKCQSPNIVPYTSLKDFFFPAEE